jgi:hypothetical protein
MRLHQWFAFAAKLTSLSNMPNSSFWPALSKASELPDSARGAVEIQSFALNRLLGGD